MRIECKSCGASGNFDETRLPASGANVRCPRCKEKIWVSPDGSPEPTVSAATAASASPRQQAPATGQLGQCTMCKRPFSTGEMVQMQGKWVCGECKPDYVQMLKIGLTRPGDYRYAGFWIRFAAKFLDNIVTGLIAFILLIPVNLVFAADPEQLAAGETTTFFLLFALQLLVQLGIPALYVTFFLGKFQATPGKMVCGLKVVRPEGEQLSYLRALGRHFGEMLSGLILAIGYLMAAFDEEKRALHDRICDTRVVYK